MRRLKQTLLALTICTLVISCSLTTSSTIMKVQRGMSQEESAIYLGNPISVDSTTARNNGNIPRPICPQLQTR